MAWDLQPGDSIRRGELQGRYGGKRRGGIAPSQGSPNVLVFTDPAVGQAHGCYDGWGQDGCFHYTGEGQRGDQKLVRGNLAILRHHDQERAFRLFRGAGGEVTYLGEFELGNDPEYYRTDAPETGGGPVRQIVVSRLRPVASVIRDDADALPAEADSWGTSHSPD
jgi:hypothetical protein